MSAKKRKRDVPVLFWVSDAEMEAIQQKMAQFGTKKPICGRWLWTAMWYSWTCRS